MSIASLGFLALLGAVGAKAGEIEADVLPYAKRAGLTVLSYGALCRGLSAFKGSLRLNQDDATWRFQTRL